MDRFVLKFEKKRVDANKCDVTELTEPVSLSTGVLKYMFLFRHWFTVSRSPDNLAKVSVSILIILYCMLIDCQYALAAPGFSWMLDLGFGAWDLNQIFTVYYWYQFMTIWQIFWKLVLAKNFLKKGLPPSRTFFEFWFFANNNRQQTSSNFIDKFQKKFKRP